MQITDRSLIAAVATGFLAAVGACAEPHCPDGFDKIGQICRRSDSGLGTIEAGANVEEDAEQSVQDPVDARTTGTDGVNQDASRDAEAAMANTTECDVNRPCTSGYACAGDKCVSACDLNKCDPSATCALSGAGTACTCNRGYINTSKVSGEVICARDLQCDQLGCHANAACEMASDQLKRCVCNPGYEGDGKICSLVSCPKLTILNGVVSGGNTYGDVATYRCNDGYEADLQNLTRTCLDTGKWSGTAPTCNGVDCGPLLASDNGSVSISAGTRYPATATYSCKSGFRLSSDLDRIRTCQANGDWSGTAPSCLGCGDKVVSPAIGEECDPAAPNWSVWSCNPSTCKKVSVYTPCSSNTECNMGLNEVCYNFSCTRTCVNGEVCPMTPPGSIAQGKCAGPVCLATGCRSISDCAPGLTCAQAYCVSCNDSAAPCPTGFECLNARCRSVQ